MKTNRRFGTMKQIFFPAFILLILLCCFPVAGTADTGYVSDMLFLTFRQGPGDRYEVLKRLPSDTRVSILEEQEQYYKVSLESGDIGWVDKRFISFNTPKSAVIETLTQENQRMQTRIQELEERIQALQAPDAQANDPDGNTAMDNQTLEASLKAARDEASRANAMLADTRKKYDDLISRSGNLREIIQENQRLLKENESLSAERTDVSVQQQGFFKTDMIKWALSGVGVLLLGWIFGHSVSVSRKRAESSLFY